MRDENEPGGSPMCVMVRQVISASPPLKCQSIVYVGIFRSPPDYL